ncbi:MAG: DUF935 family protein, partial [Armatimonadetes bacterium]|nr:DUF935 family protein [Armatimonadota bacterium]
RVGEPEGEGTWDASQVPCPSPKTMKLPFGFQIIRAADAQASRPPGGELGFTGSRRFAGLGDDEYNPDLTGTRAFDVYERMLASDGQVQAVFLVITLPIQSTRWFVEPAADDARSRQVAEFIEYNLFEGMTSPWSIVLHHALLALFYGVSILEKVFEVRDGRVYWRKFAPRHPRTISRWENSPDGGLAGLRQAGIDGQGRYREVFIPIEKLLVFTWREEWENPQGRSILRPAYKHWFIKDALYNISAVGAERSLVGVPLGRLPQGYSASDKQSLQQIIESLRSHEASGVTLPPGYDITWLEARRNPAEILPLIEHHDLQIARCVLAQFLNLGATRYGSRSLSQDHRKLFLLALNGTARWIADMFNRYAIPQLCRFNWPDLDQYPRLSHANIYELLDADAIAEQLASLTKAGLISADAEVENRIRSIMGLPELQERQPSVSAPEEEPSRAVEAAPLAHFTEPAQRRQAFAAEASRRLAGMRDDLHDALAAVLNRQLAAIAEKVAAILEEASTQKPLSRGRILARLSAIQVPYISEYRSTIRRFLDQAVEAARWAVSRATGRKVDAAIPNEVRSLLSLQADIIAKKHATDLYYAALQQVLDDWTAGLDSKTIVWNLTQRLRERASLTTENSFNRAMEAIAEAFNSHLIPPQQARS